MSRKLAIVVLLLALVLGTMYVTTRTDNREEVEVSQSERGEELGGALDVLRLDQETVKTRQDLKTIEGPFLWDDSKKVLWTTSDYGGTTILLYYRNDQDHGEFVVKRSSEYSWREPTFLQDEEGLQVVPVGVAMDDVYTPYGVYEIRDENTADRWYATWNLETGIFLPVRSTDDLPAFARME